MPLNPQVLPIIHKISLTCVILCIVSIISLIFVIVYHKHKSYQDKSLSSFFVMSLCYSDIIWEILLILNLILVASHVGELSTIDYILLILIFIAASVSTGIPALLAYCTYLSLIWSEAWLVRMKRNILIYSILLLIIVGFIGGVSFVYLIVTQSKDLGWLLASSIYLIAQPLIMISITLYSYAQIYLIFRSQCISKESRIEIYRLFLYPLIMFYVSIWPLISLFLSTFDDISKANMISQCIGFISLSLAGFFDSLAYGINAIRIMETESVTHPDGPSDKLMGQSCLDTHSGIIECSNLRITEK